MTIPAPVAIPAFDAAPSIADVVRRSLAVAAGVLVVDDGSRDDTTVRAKRAGAEVVRHPVNRGKGCALRSAFDLLFARGYDHVITLDADGQHRPEEIPKLYEPTRHGADLVIGSRAAVFSEMHPIRRASNRWSSRLISFAAGQALEDSQSGFRVYSRTMIERIGFEGRRFEAESAIVVRAVRRGFHVETLTVESGFADGRMTSHYRPLSDSLRIAWAVARAVTASAAPG